MATATKRWAGNKGMTKILVPIDDLQPHPRNPRRGNVPAIVASMERFGQQRPILALPDGTIVAGHHVYYAAGEMGWTHVAVVHSDLTDREVEAYLLADNRTADLGEYDPIALSGILGDIIDQGSALLEGTGYDADDYLDLMREIHAAAENPPVLDPTPPGVKLADRFGAPPFSVLDSRTGPWQARKRAWLESGLLRSAGRGKVLLDSPSRQDPAYYQRKRKAEKDLGRKLSHAEYANLWTEPGGDDLTATGTSQFDPVLAELMIAWMSPPDGDVLDPFAGGPTRGYVAAVLGRGYLGFDLSAEQVAANREVASTLTVAKQPQWVVGDAREMEIEPESVDMLLTCPPYYDLEKYGEDDRDLSSMTTAEFDRAHAEIIGRAAAALRPDRFAVWVIGDARDRKGNFRNFVGKTVRAFEDAGLVLYNEAVLLTPAAGAAVAARPFVQTRKLLRTHQNVLVFLKGSAREAASAAPINDGLITAADLST